MNYFNYLVFNILIYLKNIFKRPNIYYRHKYLFKNKISLEVGGPSSIFKGFFPIYYLVKSIDLVNFSSSTLWSKNNINFFLKSFGGGGNFFTAEATCLSDINNCTYDLVISSNCIEHIANPIKALFEFNRVLKVEGIIILVIPNKNNNFDHLRPYTSFEHLISDFESNIDESDLTHVDEVLSLHDLNMDPWAGGFNKFKERCLNNYTCRGIHHHVFNEEIISKILIYSNFSIIDYSDIGNDYLFIARKK